MMDVARCGNCTHAGAVKLNHSRRKHRPAGDPKVYCTLWKKQSHPFGTCPSHEPKPEDTHVQTLRHKSQLPLL